MSLLYCCYHQGKNKTFRKVSIRYLPQCSDQHNFQYFLDDGHKLHALSFLFLNLLLIFDLFEFIYACYWKLSDWFSYPSLHHHHLLSDRRCWIHSKKYFHYLLCFEVNLLFQRYCFFKFPKVFEIIFIFICLFTKKCRDLFYLGYLIHFLSYFVCCPNFDLTILSFNEKHLQFNLITLFRCFKLTNFR